MAEARATLTVATNPFAFIDHEGRPAGVCPLDPEDPRFYNKRTRTLQAVPPTSDLRLIAVGARMIDGGVVRDVPKREEEHCFRTPRRDLQWEFRSAPFQVPDTRFYRDRIAEGALFDASDGKDYEGARLLARARSQCATEPRWIDPPPPAEAATPAPPPEEAPNLDEAPDASPQDR